MKNKCLIVVILLSFSFSVIGQIVTINGGFKPNNLKGSHFGAKLEFYNNKKWSLALNYQFVKFTDVFNIINNESAGLHKEYKEDEPILKFKEFNRGVALNSKSKLLPRDLYHHFSFFLSYELFEDNNFRSNISIGPHFSLDRTYHHSYIVSPALIRINESDNEESIYYFDYDIYRDWDIGPGLRLDIDYKILENVALGINSMIFMDLISEGIDLTIGGGISFDFN